VTAGGDPYRVLGVPEGASVADVKRAYRLLAKRHHPDAGEGSVARFLEIQAAYEVLVRRDPANGDRPGAARSSGRRPAQQGPRTAGARRTGGERPGDPGAPPTPGTEWARRPREAGGRSAAGSGGRSAAGSGGTGERARRGRGPRKATLGSTTYDEASEAGEPTWEGADWYGPVSGTYWTVNPKEYADPRKHGPEYTARWAGRAGVGAPEPAPRSSRGPIPGAAAAASPGWEVRSRVAPAATTRTRTGVGSAAWPRLLERLAAVRGRLTGRLWRSRP
jgi:curved DNA-binding protein CbpA